MKTEDIIESVEDGTFANKAIIPEDINTYQIMNIPHMRVLKKLAENKYKFLFLSETETWEKDESRQYILGSMDKLNSFLKGISEGACRCSKYRFINPDPEREEHLGLIKILEKKVYRPYFEIDYKCQCTLCHVLFDCQSYEVRFGIGYSWRRSKIL